MANPIKQWEEKEPEMFMPHNKVVLSGKVESKLEPSFRRKYSRECMYRTRIISERLDGKVDYIPICIPQSLIKDKDIKDKWILLCGECRTHRGNRRDGKRYKSIYVIVKKFYLYDRKEEIVEPELRKVNIVFLDGYLCENAKPISKFKVDIDLAVNRMQEEGADYIPCIMIGEAIKKTKNLECGSHLSFFGSFQSRFYSKKISDNTFEERTAYEIAAWKIRVLD